MTRTIKVLGLVLIAVAGLLAGLLATTQEGDARARTIHPCLLGDEPCNTPAPTPSPRSFDLPVTVSSNGRLVGVKGRADCTAGFQLYILVEVTQGAVKAVGQTLLNCSTTQTVSWAVQAAATGPTPLHPGAAQACVDAITLNLGRNVHIVEWCRAVDLVPG